MSMLDTIKCVVVGSSTTGKTAMMVTYTTNELPQEYVPTVFDNYSTNVTFAGSTLTLRLWDTAGHDDYDRLRPLSYPDTDVLIVCFSVVDPASFQSVKKKWVQEITRHCQGTPFLLVGMKIDLREDSSIIKELSQNNQKPVTVEDAEKLAEEIGAVKYVECSALTQDGLKVVFNEAIKAAIEADSKKALYRIAEDDSDQEQSSSTDSDKKEQDDHMDDDDGGVTKSNPVELPAQSAKETHQRYGIDRDKFCDTLQKICDLLNLKITKISLRKECEDRKADLSCGATSKRTPLDDFELLLLLGKGGHGKVFLAEHKVTRKQFAIKAERKIFLLKEDEIDCAIAERRTLLISHQHPFLTALHSCFQTEKHLFYTMEYNCGGDFVYHITEHGRFPEDTMRFYSAEIVCALLFLHKRGIIHRNLKLQSVMLGSDGHVKLTSFHFCKDGMVGGRKTRTFCGTPDYMAPEIIMYMPYGASVDWWALGVWMYEVAVGCPPFDGEDDDELLSNITQRTVQFPHSLSRECTSILSGFLTKSVSQRLGCHPDNGERDIKTHIFYKSIDWSKLEQKKITPPLLLDEKKLKKAGSYFDPEFTHDPVTFTPEPKDVVIDQKQFKGFSYTNSEFCKEEASGHSSVHTGIGIDPEEFKKRLQAIHSKLTLKMISSATVRPKNN